MTLFRGTCPRHPREPVHRRHPARRRRRRPAGRATASIVERGSFAALRAAPPRRGGRRPDAAASCCPGSSTPTCTSPRSARSAAWGCRCWTGSSSCALPEEARLADPGYAEAVAGEFVDGPGRSRAPPPRWSSAPTSRPRWTSSSPQAAAGGSADHQRARRQRPAAAATTCSPRPTRAYDEGRALADALARRRPQPVRRDPALLALLQRRAARRRARRCTPTSTARCSPRTSTRTSARSPTVARALRRSTHYLEHLRPHGLVGQRSVLAHNVHPTDGELKLLAARDAGVAHCPTSNCRPRQRALPAAPPRRGTAYGWRSAPTSAPAPASRCSRRACRPTSCSSCSATMACRCSRPPAPPCDRRRCRCAGSRRAVGDLGVGKRFDAHLAAPRAGHAPSTSPCAALRAPTTRWPRRSRWRRPRM